MGDGHLLTARIEGRWPCGSPRSPAAVQEDMLSDDCSGGVSPGDGGGTWDVYPHKILYSWKKSLNTICCRLDRFYISESLLNNVHSVINA